MALLAGKKIIVTGCASGIGAETTKALQEQGAHVLGVDINRTSIADTFFQADLSSKKSIDDLVAALPGDIDGLANIAGVPPTMPASLVVTVNLVAVKYMTSSLIPKLADGASIVNLASLAGFGWANAIPQIKDSYDLTFESVDKFVAKYDFENAVAGRSYFFAKEALVAWTFMNRWTWRDRGIRMNAVSPGPVDTPILKDFVETLGDRAEEDMEVMDRPGKPQDIAPVVAFLLSDATTWFRGANLTCDGGMSSHLLQKIHDL